MSGIIDAAVEVLLGVVASMIFAIMASQYKKKRRPAREQPGYKLSDPSPRRTPASDSGRTYTFATEAETEQELLARRREVDRTSLGILFGLCITLLPPFLLGGAILGIVDSTGSSGFITEDMRDQADNGYIQYWLGFSVITTFEIGLLLFRPWRGRTFGVAAATGLILLLIFFGIPASRGARIL